MNHTRLNDLVNLSSTFTGKDRHVRARLPHWTRLRTAAIAGCFLLLQVLAASDNYFLIPLPVLLLGLVDLVAQPYCKLLRQ